MIQNNFPGTIPDREQCQSQSKPDDTLPEQADEDPDLTSITQYIQWTSFLNQIKPLVSEPLQTKWSIKSYSAGEHLRHRNLKNQVGSRSESWGHAASNQRFWSPRQKKNDKNPPSTTSFCNLTTFRLTISGERGRIPANLILSATLNKTFWRYIVEQISPRS